MTDEQQLDLLRIRNESFVREIIFHHEVESTNSTAMELSKTEVATPVLVIAEAQTAGRGRGSNAWWSARGSLLFTLLIDVPMLRPQQIGAMSLTIGLAICQALEKIAPSADLALKWPNDVFLEGKKVCGILIENPNASEPRLAIGIGLNVNNSLTDAPIELQTVATSLCDQFGSKLDANVVLLECLAHLESRIQDHVHRPDSLLDQWRAYCMLLGRDVAVEMAGKTLTGKCEGVDQNGALLVTDSSGELHRCIAGSVSV